MKILTKSIGCGFRSKFDHQRFCLCGFQMYISKVLKYIVIALKRIRVFFAYLFQKQISLQDQRP